MLDNFKSKNAKNFDKNLLKSLSLDNLYKNNISENTININKINSDYSLSEHLGEKNEDKKKIISDNKIFDLYENNQNDISDKLIPPKINMFSSSSLNNLGGLDPYPPLLYDAMNRQQSGNMESNLHLNRFQSLASSSFPNSLNHPPSLNNMNNINITPPGINQRNIMNIYNNIKPSNNILPINSDNFNKKTFLSPPLPMNNISFPTLAKITPPPLISSVNDKNINNFTFSNGVNETMNENEKNSSILNMLDKKRKRDIKNNKLVFILGDNKKDKKEKEIKKQKANNETEKKENVSKNDENSEKNIKPRGSKFRGVSRNGNQWQVLIMVNKKKRYVGSYSKEEDAARAYDKVALQNHGSKAKTNFDYTKKEVEEILSSPQLLKIN
jgi:hypothetical protein